MARKTYTDGEINLLNEAFEKLLRLVGIRENFFSNVFFDTKNSVDTPLTLYVETTGDDGNDGTPNKPFKTVQGALNSLPLKRNSSVTIKVGIGTFSDSWKVSGFSISSDVAASVDRQLEIQGTMIDATATTGTNTGTVTGAASSNLGSTVTDGGQTWTVNDFKGKLLLITSGAAAGTYSVITSNDATTLTLTPLASITNFNGNTYQILNWGTVFDTASGKLDSYSTGTNVPSTVAAGVLENSCSVRFLKFTSNRGLYINDAANPTVTDCEFAPSTAGSTAGIVTASNTANSFLNTTRCVFRMFNTSSGLISSSFTHYTSSHCLFIGAGTGGANPAMNIATTNRSFFSIANTKIENFAIGIQLFLTGQVNFVSSILDTCGTGIKVIGGNSFLNIGSSALTNCTTGIHASEFGSVVKIYAAFSSGTGTTTGLKVERGGSIRFVSTVTGIGSTEANVDGTTSTIAAIKALSPPILKDANWLSRIYQGTD